MTDRVTDILSGLPAGSLEPQLRASIAMAEARRIWRRDCASHDARLCETVRRECAYALEPIATAILHPKISRAYLEGAIASLLRAHEAAAELDPAPESGEAA